MSGDFYIEVASEHRNCGEERICGDVFLSRKVKEENRTIVVLSDGMGHGVKANVLATLTATMAINFTIEHKDVETIADIIMNTLPVCSERHMSYSTFTIIDIEHDGKVSILEYDNPQCIILRNNKAFNPEWNCIIMESERNAGKEIRTCEFEPMKEDRIIICSDGVAQSGLGTDKYPLGWGIERMEKYAIDLINNSHKMSARKLAGKMVNMAHRNDDFFSKDDTSCASIYFRHPRKLLLVTGPPYEESKDVLLSQEVKKFKGKKII